MIYNVKSTEYDDLVSVWESSVKATHHFLSGEDFEFYKELVPTFFDQVTLHCVQNENQQITGFIGTNEHNLEMLFVAADQRGKGLGKELLLFAIRNLTVTKVDVNAQNEQAVKFYEYFGFETKSVSELDGFGKPYPILHMELNKTVDL
ncbi:putative N-acetyltransferase YjaB [compost metagenome]